MTSKMKKRRTRGLFGRRDVRTRTKKATWYGVVRRWSKVYSKSKNLLFVFTSEINGPIRMQFDVAGLPWSFEPEILLRRSPDIDLRDCLHSVSGKLTLLDRLMSSSS